jgi:hypothetical protein
MGSGPVAWYYYDTHYYALVANYLRALSSCNRTEAK